MKKVNKIFKNRLTNKLNYKCRYYLETKKFISRRRKIYNIDNSEYFLLLYFKFYFGEQARIQYYDGKDNGNKRETFIYYKLNKSLIKP